MDDVAFPKRYDLVVCRVTKIDPHSASCEVIEYKKMSGLIHATEVAKKWVRDIRDFLKEGQYIVCRVMDVDRRTNTILLSAKRLSSEEGQRKLNEFKRERKSEKILELIGKGINKSLEQVHGEIGHTLREEFGSFTKALEMASKNPAVFKNKLGSKLWSDAILEFVEKNASEKIHEIKVKLKLVSYKSNGVEIIKRVLSNSGDFEVKYISAPTYMLIGKGKNFKELKSKIGVKAEELAKEMTKSGGEASFEILE